MDSRIRSAVDSDLPYIYSLARKHSEALGFLPPPAVEHYLTAGAVWLCEENGDDAGFCVVRPVLALDPRCSAILQACVQMDAQRRHHGLEMIQRVREAAAAAGRSILQCWCAADLESNDFWRAAGFRPIAQRDGGRRRDRQHILWRLPLVAWVNLDFVVIDKRRGPLAAVQPKLQAQEQLRLPWDDNGPLNRLF